MAKNGKKERKLTAKQESYAVARATGMNQQVSARIAGYEDSMLPVISTKVEQKVLVRQRIQELMDRAGLSNRSLLRTHRALLKQDRTVFDKGIAVAEVVDADIRLRALDMAYKLKGVYVVDHSSGITIHISIPGAVAKDAERMVIDVPAKDIPQDVVVEDVEVEVEAEKPHETVVEEA